MVMVVRGPDDEEISHIGVSGESFLEGRGDLGSIITYGGGGTPDRCLANPR